MGGGRLTPKTVRHPQSAVRHTRSGVRHHKSGVRHHKSGVRHLWSKMSTKWSKTFVEQDIHKDSKSLMVGLIVQLNG